MITYRTIGKELEKELGEELSSVQKEQKRKRDKIRKGYKGRSKLPYTETTWKWESTKLNKWFLKTSVEGKVDKPKVISHSHVTIITSSGSNKYLIPRGYKPRPDGKVGGYVVSIKAPVVNEIKKSLGLEEDHHEIVSKIFNYTEKAVYLPCDWNVDDEEPKEKPEDYVPTIDEMWAEYLGQAKPEEKPKVKKHEDLPQLILKTSLGFFLGCIREQKEIILEVFMKEDEFDGESRNRIEKVINPAYEFYNTDDKERMKEIQKQIEETLVGDEEVYLLFP